MRKAYIPLLLALAISLAALVSARKEAADSELAISWKDGILSIHGDHIPGKRIETWYLEAYCRPGSTKRAWSKTVIGHETELVMASPDKKRIRLKCVLRDGVTVVHEIRASKDEVAFTITATNPTDATSEAHWAQPCIRVGDFTGTGVADTDDKFAYLPKSFVFLDGKLERMPTRNWATEALYVPGQVWCPAKVDRNDVNPRPLSELVPSNGLIGCFSKDEKWIMATAFEPYQELFQGVIRCLHSDFRIGGLNPGQTKKIRGKIYLVPAEVDALVKRYERDFPEHVASPVKRAP